MLAISTSRFALTVVAVFLFTFSVAQDSLAKGAANNELQENDLTVSYSVELRSNRNNTGIGETYTGGVKTVFISGEKARIRLVSLMRTESIFILPGNSTHHAVVAKESGKNKYKYYLGPGEWDQFNRKYDSVTCQLTYDSAVILNYPCRKAIISLKDGRTIGVYYTDSIKRKLLGSAEPVFSCIPGLVLQYEYRYKKGKIIYTATSIHAGNIDPVVFRVPGKGFATRKFSMKPVSEKIVEPADEDGEEMENE